MNVNERYRRSLEDVYRMLDKQPTSWDMIADKLLSPLRGQESLAGVLANERKMLTEGQREGQELEGDELKRRKILAALAVISNDDLEYFVGRTVDLKDPRSRCPDIINEERRKTYELFAPILRIEIQIRGLKLGI